MAGPLGVHGVMLGGREPPPSHPLLTLVQVYRGKGGNGLNNISPFLLRSQKGL